MTVPTMLALVLLVCIRLERRRRSRWLRWRQPGSSIGWAELDLGRRPTGFGQRRLTRGASREGACSTQPLQDTARAR